MRIKSLDTFVLRIPLDEFAGSREALGKLVGMESDPAPYLGTALIRVSTECGLCGWGEAQAPLAPELIASIVEMLLRPILIGEEFNATASEVEAMWDRMFDVVRAQGQASGFILDAMSGIDLALWDLAGKAAGVPVWRLLRQSNARSEADAYVGALAGDSPGKQAEAALILASSGFRAFRVSFDADYSTLIHTILALRSRLGSKVQIAVNARWRLTPWTAPAFGRLLDEHCALWLENPLPPEQYAAHRDLARVIRTPVAIGECYRNSTELAPFFETEGIQVVQPDVGRCGLTEALRMCRAACRLGVGISPRLRIAFGPQIAAVLQLAAAVENCCWIEYHPWMLEIANRYCETPIRLQNGRFQVPGQPGIGISYERLPTSYLRAPSSRF